MREIIILVFITMLLGCDDNVVSESKEYIILNSTEHKVDFTAYYNSSDGSSSSKVDYIFNENEKERILKSPKYKSGALEESPFLYADSIVILYNNSVYIKFDIGRIDGNPMLIQNFVFVEGSNKPYQYLFEITQEDFDLAVKKGEIL